MSERTNVSGDHPLVGLVGAERRRRRAAVAREAAGWGLAGVAVVAAVAAIALGGGRWLDLPRWAPLLAWALAVAAVVAAVVVARRRARRVTVERVAADAERERGLRTGALRAAIEGAGVGSLGALAASRLASNLGVGAPLTPSARAVGLRRTRVAAGAGGLALAVAALSAARWHDGARAVVHPLGAWSGTLAEPLTLEAPDAVLRGAPVVVRVRAAGRRRVWVETRQTGEGARGAWHPVLDGVASVPLGVARADLRVRANDGRSGAAERLVRVTDRAYVGDVAVRAEYPAYLSRAAEHLDPAVGELRVPRGTRLFVTARPTAALRALALVGGADTVALHAESRGAYGAVLAAEHDVAWQWSADAGGAVDVPAPLRVSVIPDSAPTVELSAAGDTVVVSDGTAQLAVRASDDHALGAVSLRAWRVTGTGTSGAPQTTELLAAPAPSYAATSPLSLGGFELGPGDALHVVAEAVDASPWRQRTASREVVLRVPNEGESRVLARAAGDSLSAAAEQAARAARQLEQRTADAARSRGSRGASARATPGDASGQSRAAPPQPGTMDYASADRAKALAADQRAMAAQVDKLREQAKSLEGQLRQAGALDSGLAGQLREAQRMLRDALTPQMREQLSKLENAASGLSEEQTRSAMQDLQRQQQAMREQLEKSAEMLKRAALEGSMETLRDEARDVAKQQRAVADRQSGRDDRGQQQGSTSQPGAKQGASQQQGSQADAAQPQAGGKQGASPDERAVAQRAKQLGSDVRDLQKRLDAAKAEAGAQAAAEAAARAEASAKLSERASRGAESAQRSDASAQRGEPRAGQQSGAQQAAGQQSAGQHSAGQQSSGEQSAGQPKSGAGQRAQASRDAAAQMDSAASQLGRAREQQVAAWKQDLTKEIDRSVQEMLQMARAEEELAKQQQGGAAQSPPASAGSAGSQGAPGQKPSASGEKQGSSASGSKSESGGQQSGGQQSGGQQSAGQQSGGEQSAGQQPGGQQSGGQQSGDARSAQSSLQQGVEKTAGRLQEAARKSSLVSGGTQRAVGDARQKVSEATRATATAEASPDRTAQAMRDAAAALNQAAASLVRDRARANSASSASGFSEMVQEMKDLAKQQGALNAQAQGLSLGAGAGQQPGPAATRHLAQQQRDVAESLDELGDADGTGRAAALAAEAKRLAQALEGGAVDPATLQRQQQLYRRMLDAGRTMERDEPDTQGPREAHAATGTAVFTPGTADASGRAAARFREPTWNELRGLSPEERQLVLDYFKRLNATP